MLKKKRGSRIDTGSQRSCGVSLRSLKDLQGKTIRVQDSQIDAAENNGPAYYLMDCPE